jgi:hypothetical protein
MAAETAAEEPKREALADVPVNKVLNITEQQTLETLRGKQHKDAYGNPIGTYTRHEA